MKILSLDTAMAACSVAVVDTAHDVPLSHTFVPMERGHAEALAPMVSQVMQDAGIGFGEIDRIVVTTGPGTFTGVRIGLSLARGIGLARSIPVIGIDLKDPEPAARRFLDEHGNPFSRLATDPQGRAAIDWGVTAPPETFILDGEGRVLYRFAGPLVREDYAQRFRPELDKALAGQR